MTIATAHAPNFLEIARGRRVEALTARNLLLCDRHERPATGLILRALRALGI